MNWRDKRTAAAAQHAAALERRRLHENAVAQRMLDDFTAAALDSHLPTVQFVVRGFGGRGSARTNVEGWLLRRDGTIGLSTQGQLYRLTAPLSMLDRFRRVAPEPIDPPRVIGAGGRDGDSISLADALNRLLPGWQSKDEETPPSE